MIALLAMPYLALLAFVFFSGLTVVGSQTGLECGVRQALSGAHAHERLRLGLGVGRLGGIAAAPLGGFLLARGLPPRYVFLCACLFAAIAAVATALLALPGRQTSRVAAMEMA